MNSKKLFAAADFIEKLDEAQLNMRHWNTCAIGRLAAAGVIKGLTLWVDPVTFDTDVEYGRTHHFDAVAKCFGIKQGHAVDLFGGYNIAPADLAASIRAFVRNKQGEYANVEA
jgi:hypothetical protein